jgi:pentatricopeptide repeat protein
VKQHLQLLGRDTVSWNALIAMYARGRSVEEALKSIGRMQCEGFAPDAATFTSALIVCAGAGAIGYGQQMHKEIIIRNFLKDQNMELCNSLVGMYAKCGMLTKAKRVLLRELPARNTVSWNALLAGYARQGQARESLDCFKQMKLEGISPDDITLSCILKAWSRTQLIDMTLIAFKDMDAKHGIAPKQEHCTSMVFGLGLAGRFGEAMSAIETMPSSDYPPLWLALLSACRRWGNVELARLAFDRLVRMRHSCPRFSLCT